MHRVDMREMCWILRQLIHPGKDHLFPSVAPSPPIHTLYWYNNPLHFHSRLRKWVYKKGTACDRFNLNYSLLHQVTQFSSVESLSRVWLFATPWTTACQASLSITNSWSLLKLMSIELVMPSNHLILCCPLLLLPSIFPSIRVFSNESTLHEVAKVLEFQL